MKRTPNKRIVIGSTTSDPQMNNDKLTSFTDVVATFKTPFATRYGILFL